MPHFKCSVQEMHARNVRKSEEETIELFYKIYLKNMFKEHLLLRDSILLAKGTLIPLFASYKIPII